MPHTSIPKTRKPPAVVAQCGCRWRHQAHASHCVQAAAASDGEPSAPFCGNPPPTVSGSPDAAGFLAVVEPPGRSSSTASSSSGNHPILPARPELHLPGFEARASAGPEATRRASKVRGRAQARSGRPRPRQAPPPRPGWCGGSPAPPANLSRRGGERSFLLRVRCSAARSVLPPLPPRRRGRHRDAAGGIRGRRGIAGAGPAAVRGAAAGPVAPGLAAAPGRALGAAAPRPGQRDPQPSSGAAAAEAQRELGPSARGPRLAEAGRAGGEPGAPPAEVRGPGRRSKVTGAGLGPGARAQCGGHGWEGGLVLERSWPHGTVQSRGCGRSAGGRAWENFANLPSRESALPGKVLGMGEIGPGVHTLSLRSSP